MMKIFTVGVLLASSLLYAKINIVASILPEQTFIKAIAGDKADISLMVKPGNEPHSYEPKPSQMKDIAAANIYFAIGVEFENTWLKRFEDLNKNMKIVDLSKHIKKMPMREHHHHDIKASSKSDTSRENIHEGLDPHIWTSPANVRIIAKDIYENLVKIDNKNKAYYKNNYDKFVNYIIDTDNQIKQILANNKNSMKFMVFHPAWGYFARDYGLVQLAIESGGKNPKPQQVIYLIKEAKKEKVKAIFTEPEFSTKVANQIAKEAGIPVLKASPLNPKWSENLINLAKSIAN